MSSRPDTFTRLLPANQTRMEGALVHASTPPFVTELAIDEVSTLDKPDLLRTAWLPWLAWAWDALYWPLEQQEEMRRKILRESFRMHRIAGTLGSYKRVARYAGFEVVSAIRPPDKTFCGAALTLADRNAWLRQFPQLRVYPFRSRGTAAGSHLGWCYLGDTNGSACWPAIGDAIARIGDRAYLYRDGAETLLVSALVETETSEGTLVTAREARLPGKFPYTLFCGGSVGGYPSDTQASLRVYRTWDESPYDDRSAAIRITAARPSLTPLRLQYDSVAVTGSWSLGNGIFLSCRRAQGPDVQACFAHTGGKTCGFVDGHFADLDAGRRIYRRLYLFDPAAPPIYRGRSTHLGAVRLGLPHYHAVLRVKARRTPHRRVAFCPTVGPLHPSALDADKRITAVRNVLSPVRSARDKIQFSTRTRGPLTAGGRLFASPSLVCGAYSAIQEVR